MMLGKILSFLIVWGIIVGNAYPAENLLMITFDGLRWQEVFGGVESQMMVEQAGTRNLESLKEKYWAETPKERREILLPFFWNVVAKEGQVFGDAKNGSEVLVTNGFNFSYPGYNELLTGAGDPDIDSNDKNYNKNVTVLEWLNNKPAFAGKVAAASSWDVFPFIINSERSGIPVNAGWDGVFDAVQNERTEYLKRIAPGMPHYWHGVRFDVFTHEWAVEYIKAHKPRVMYVAYGETDDWAHDRKYDMYIESAHKTDEFIRELWELLQSMPEYKDKTALLISTDHGRGKSIINWTSHGEKHPESVYMWSAVMGPGVPAKGIVKNISAMQGQYAATAAALLGEDFCAENPKAAPTLPLE
jgi:hypothetical protein